MYKISSNKKQKKLHRGKLTDWINGKEDPAQIEERRQDLRRRLRWIEEQITITPKGPFRRELGLLKKEASDEIAAMPKPRKRMDVNFFIDAAIEILPKAKYEEIQARSVAMKNDFISTGGIVIRGKAK